MEFSISINYAAQFEATDKRRWGLFGSVVESIVPSWEGVGIQTK